MAASEGRAHIHQPPALPATTPRPAAGAGDATGTPQPGNGARGVQGRSRRPRLPRVRRGGRGGRAPRRASQPASTPTSTPTSSPASSPASARASVGRSSTSLETAAQAFRMLTTGPAPLSLDGATVGHGLPARLIPLDEVRAIVLHPATGRAARDAVWRHVIGEAHAGTPAWVIGAVGLALPALWQMAGELSEGYTGDVGDLQGAILAGFVAGLHHIDAGRPGVITRLRWAAYRAGLVARYTRDGLPTLPLARWESAPPPQPWGHPDLLLADAVAKGVLSPLAAELIGRSRLEGVSLKQAAAELGVGVQAAYKTRRRGERRLVAAISSGDVEHRLSNPAAISGLFRVPAPTTPAPPAGQAPKPDPAGGPVGGSAHEPVGARDASTTSDGTPKNSHPPREGGAFCHPAHQPPPQPAPPPASDRHPPSSGRPSQRDLGRAQPDRRQPDRQQTDRRASGGRRQRRPRHGTHDRPSRGNEGPGRTGRGNRGQTDTGRGRGSGGLGGRP